MLRSQQAAAARPCTGSPRGVGFRWLALDDEQPARDADGSQAQRFNTDGTLVLVSSPHHTAIASNAG